VRTGCVSGRLYITARRGRPDRWPRPAAATRSPPKPAWADPGGRLHPFVTLSLALTTLAATAGGPAPSPLEPGTPGYRLPWHRPTRDSVVDLAPGDLVDRFEFRGRLVSNDDRPVAGLLVYAYHADRQGEYGGRNRGRFVWFVNFRPDSVATGGARRPEMKPARARPAPDALLSQLTPRNRRECLR